MHVMTTMPDRPLRHAVPTRRDLSDFPALKAVKGRLSNVSALGVSSWDNTTGQMQPHAALGRVCRCVSVQVNQYDQYKFFLTEHVWNKKYKSSCEQRSPIHLQCRTVGSAVARPVGLVIYVCPQRRLVRQRLMRRQAELSCNASVGIFCAFPQRDLSLLRLPEHLMTN